MEKIKIEEYSGVTRITGITKDILDLNKTFNCGQCFRWKKLAEDTYMGVIYDVPVLLKQLIFDDGVPGIATNISVDIAKELLIGYMQLEIDYDTEIKIDARDSFALKSREYGKGIRVLWQEPWEALVSFIISQRNNIPKITSTIKKLCEKLGDEVSISVGHTTYRDYTFPTAEKIAEVGLDGLQGIGLGYRDQYIIEAARLVSSGKFNLYELARDTISGEAAVYKLQELYGVGPKVANCVALFGLGKFDMFPIDVWMQRVIDTYYRDGIDIQSYGKLAGVVQQYMFYYIKNN